MERWCIKGPCTVDNCAAKDCPRHLVCRGFCQMHYERLLYAGDYRGHLIVCQGCGDGFWSVSSKSIACSSLCRKGLKYYYNLVSVERRGEEVDRYQRQYREAHREKLRMESRIRYKKNPDKVREANHIDRVKRRGVITSGKKIPPRFYPRTLERYNHCCAYCGVSVRGKHQWDHVVPISRGGGHSEGNLLPSCAKCNNSKRAAFISEWKRRYSFNTPHR